MTLEEVFVNKKLCNAVRYVSKNSPISIETAIELLEESKDYKRDREIIRKLSIVGLREKIIKQVIYALNRDE